MVWRGKRDKGEGERGRGRKHKGSQKPGLTELDSLVNSEEKLMQPLIIPDVCISQENLP